MPNCVYMVHVHVVVRLQFKVLTSSYLQCSTFIITVLYFSPRHMQNAPPLVCLLVQSLRLLPAHKSSLEECALALLMASPATLD